MSTPENEKIYFFEKARHKNEKRKNRMREKKMPIPGYVLTLYAHL